MVDLNLRDGLTGPQIASKLVYDHATLVVFMTGSPEQIPADYAGPLGAIIKPWDPTTLEQLVSFVRGYRIAPKGSTGAPPKMTTAPLLRNYDVALAASF